MMMKLSITLLSAAVAVSAASPHRHGHQHFHKEKRVPHPNPDYVTVPGPVEYIYVLNGQTIPKWEVDQGIQNGSLIFAPNGELANAAPAYTPPASTSVYVAPTTSSTSVFVAPTPTTPPAPAYTPGAAWGSDATGLDTDFPDGQCDCSTFPSEYGAVPVEWTGLGGWTGVQCPGSSDSSGFSNIETLTSGSTCQDGGYCSYACPPGYQKSQWPSTQGSTGQSVGGLACKNGKLFLTNPGLSTKLCIQGNTNVNILAKNTLSKNVAICRTDYPGTESETVPVDVQPGSTAPLTCPDASNYYKWQGSSTSAQYYVNPEGVSVEDACQWGSSANPWGNYAPVNIGVGWSNGAAWLSIFQNAPTTNAKLDFSIDIEGDSVSGTCKYSNGQYCGGANYGSCSSTTGCTVSLSSGTATFVFSS